MRVLAAIGLVLACCLTACRREEAGFRVQSVDVQDFREVRDYGWPCRVNDPQPAWHPSTYAILVRAPGGVGVLREGRDRQRYFEARDRRNYFDPCWLDEETIILCPDPILKKHSKGGLEMPRYGIMSVRLEEGELVDDREFAIRGYAARPWNGELLVQWGEEIQIADGRSDPEVYMPGAFHPVPQPPTPDGAPGRGLCYNEKPYLWADHWTAIEGPGDLIVHWDEGLVDRIPRGREAAWTPRGGVVAAVLPAEADDRPNLVVHLSGPGREVRVLAAGARAPRPNPRFDLLACCGSDGSIRMLSMDGTRERVVADSGWWPRWSHDGLRLLYLRRRADGGTELRVVIFRPLEAEPDDAG